MATIRTWPVALALLLVLPAAAEASYKYTATIRFVGHLHVGRASTSGVVIGHVQSATKFTVQRRAARRSPSRTGRSRCSRPATRRRAWRRSSPASGSRATRAARLSPTGSRTARARLGDAEAQGSRATLGFGWTGESIDRSYAGAWRATAGARGGRRGRAATTTRRARRGWRSGSASALRVPLSSLMQRPLDLAQGHRPQGRQRRRWTAPACGPAWTAATGSSLSGESADRPVVKVPGVSGRAAGASSGRGCRVCSRPTIGRLCPSDLSSPVPSWFLALVATPVASAKSWARRCDHHGDPGRVLPGETDATY